MTIQRVHVIGSGLIGSSLGLALSRCGVHVTLEDISSTNAALARDLGAGALSEPLDTPDVVVAATPPTSPPESSRVRSTGGRPRW